MGSCPLEMIKQKLQNPEKLKKNPTPHCQETLLYIRNYICSFNKIEFKDKKSDVSLNLRSYMITYRLYNYCMYIYLDYR